MSKKITPVKAIRLYCLECSGGSFKDVRECVIPDCPLYPFRLGKNPNYTNTKPQDEEVPPETPENSTELFEKD